MAKSFIVWIDGSVKSHWIVTNLTESAVKQYEALGVRMTPLEGTYVELNEGTCFFHMFPNLPKGGARGREDGAEDDSLEMLTMRLTEQEHRLLERDRVSLEELWEGTCESRFINIRYPC